MAHLLPAIAACVIFLGAYVLIATEKWVTRTAAPWAEPGEMPTDQLSLTFAALADPTRRSILTLLADGEATVTRWPHGSRSACLRSHGTCRSSSAPG